MPLDLLTGLHLAALAPLAVLGLHRGWLVWLCSRARHGRPPAGVAAARERACEPAACPTVTVQLPIYNERFVAARAIRAAAALDWPRDRLEIQVLDDSTDDTSAIVAACLAELDAEISAVHVQRGHREGFKAGALAAGLQRARGQLVAVFDADFVPPPRLLREVVAEFADPRVGMVQARWEHLNAGASVLTRTQAMLLDGHFAVEHPARAGNGCFFNFNGTAGVFRRACIEDAGGWQADTLTEDVDLSYRAQMRGWRFVYRLDASCPAELPADMSAFLNQQRRWAQGSIQTARKLLPAVLRAELPLSTKLEAGFHLLGNVAFPLLLLLILVTLPLQAARLATGAAVPAWLAVVEGLPLVLSTGCVIGYYGLAQHWLGRSARPWRWLQAPMAIAIGAGLCVNNTAAVVRGLRRGGEFVRTPKDGGARPTRPRYVSRRGLLPVGELALGAWALTTAGFALRVGLPVTACFHGIFAAGLLWTGLSSLRLRPACGAAAPAPSHPLPR